MKNDDKENECPGTKRQPKIRGKSDNETTLTEIFVPQMKNSS